MYACMYEYCSLSKPGCTTLLALNNSAIAVVRINYFWSIVLVACLDIAK